MKMKNLLRYGVAVCSLFAVVNSIHAQGTAFNYQGRLSSGTNPANGQFDFEFTLFSDPAFPLAVTAAITNSAVGVTNGVFNTTLNFGGSAFGPSPRWLGLGVRTNGSSSGFTILSPRQQVNPTPFAIYSEASGIASSVAANGLTGAGIQDGTITGAKVAAGQVVKSLNGLGDSVTLSAGTNISLLPNGNTIQINSGGPGGSYVARTGDTMTGNLNFSTPGVLGFGAATRQMIDLWDSGGTVYAIGVENSTFYQRTGAGGGGFAWYQGGSHDDAPYSAGGGTTLMTLDQYGDLNVTALSANGPVSGTSAGFQFSAGVLGLNTGDGSGVFGTSSGAGAGISGDNTGTGQAGHFHGDVEVTGALIADGPITGVSSGLPFSIGVWGEDTSGWASSIGVAGTSTSGKGVSGTSGANDGVFGSSARNGVHGVSSSGSDSAVWGNNTGGGYGVTGTSDAANGLGVYGRGPDKGVYGLTSVAGPTHAGVFGENSAVGGTAVVGNALNANSAGVAGVADFPGSTGVYGRGSLWGGYFDGPVSVCSLTIRGGCDMAEPFQMSGKMIPRGAVVIIDDENAGNLKISERPYDTRVAGIVSGANGINSGLSLHQEGMLEGGQNVALSGRVYVLADAGGGSIKPGDLLTTSGTPGHAMKVADHLKGQGAIIGKAMSELKAGRGMVLVLVSLQ